MEALDGQSAGGGLWLEGLQDAGGDGGEVEGLAAVEAALAAGEGEQCLDELFLLVAGFQQVLAGGPVAGQGGVGVGEGHLQQGAGEGERGAQFVGGAGDELALGVEGCLQPFEQAVDGVAEVFELVAGAGDGQPLVQVVFGDRPGGGGHFP